jgi:hypothetical protein
MAFLDYLWFKAVLRIQISIYLHIYVHIYECKDHRVVTAAFLAYI